MHGLSLETIFRCAGCYARHGRQGLAAESTQTGIADFGPLDLYSACRTLPTRGAGGNLRWITRAWPTGWPEGRRTQSGPDCR